MVDVSANASSLLAAAVVVGNGAVAKQPLVADMAPTGFAAALVDAAAMPGIPAIPATPAALSLPPMTDLPGEPGAALPSSLPAGGAITAAMPAAPPAAKGGKELPVLAVRQGLAAARHAPTLAAGAMREDSDALPSATLAMSGAETTTALDTATILPMAGEAATRFAHQILSAPLPTEPRPITAATARRSARADTSVAALPTVALAAGQTVAASTAGNVQQGASKTDLLGKATAEQVGAPLPATLTVELEAAPVPREGGRITTSMPSPLATAVVNGSKRAADTGLAKPAIAIPAETAPSRGGMQGVPTVLGSPADASDTQSAKATDRPLPFGDTGQHTAEKQVQAPAIEPRKADVATKEATRVQAVADPRIEPRTDATIVTAAAPADAGQVEPAAKSITPTPAQQRVDVATLVDTIARARDDAGSAAPVAVALTHAEFGKVSLRFRHEDDGLSVSMTSADPAFAPAVAAAGQAQATPDMRQQQQGNTAQQDSPRAEAQGRSPEARADPGANTGGGSGQSAANGGPRQDNGRPTSNPSPRGNARSGGDSPQSRDGIFA